MHLGAEIAEIWNLDMHSPAISLRALAEAQQDAFIMPYILFVMDCGTPSSQYQQNSTQEQSAALSRPHRHFVQLELGHDYPAVKIVTSSSTAGLEGRLSRYELGYNRETLRDENRTHNLMAEMELLGHSLCSLLLQPMAKPGSREQTRRQIVDAVRDARTDVMAAEAEVKVQTIHEKSTERVLDPGVSDYPMTAGHVEIQAVNEAAKEVSNAVLSLNNVIKDLPSQLSQDHQTLLHGNLDSVSRGILRFPAYLTSLLVRRMAELDATRKDKDAAAETLGAAEQKMAAAEAKQTEVVAKTEAFERDKCVAGGKMREAAELLQAVETRERLVSGRERRIVRLEEERALEDLNHGANAAMEDEAEAAAAEARESQHSISPILGLTAAVRNENFPTNLEKISSCPSVEEHVLLGRGTAIAAKEEELWHRENNLAFRETNLHHRETAIFAREQLLEQMKFAQIQLTDNWKAQVDISYAGLEAEGEDLGAKFRALIALKGRVEETQAKVRSLIGEARGMVRVGGRDEGEDKEA
ncbi:MAG: hypothetical protein Q9175_000923 [Cornicularia normoerica]